MSRRSDEYKLQVEVVKVLRSRGILVFSIPNERNAGISDAVRMRASGLTKGVPDLMAWDSKHQCWWLELKTPTGTRSQEQVAFEQVAHAYNIGYKLVRSIKDVEDIK